MRNEELEFALKESFHEALLNASMAPDGTASLDASLLAGSADTMATPIRIRDRNPFNYASYTHLTNSTRKPVNGLMTASCVELGSASVKDGPACCGHGDHNEVPVNTPTEEGNPTGLTDSVELPDVAVKQLAIEPSDEEVKERNDATKESHPSMATALVLDSGFEETATGLTESGLKEKALVEKGL